MLTTPPPRHADDGPPVRHARTLGHITATGIQYAAAPAGALFDLDFDAPAGTATHIVAQSGADASTLLGLLVGLYTPEAGVITLDGVDYRDLPQQAIRARVALVLNDPWMMDGSLAENITFGDPSISWDRVESVARLSCVDEIASRYDDGLHTRVEKVELSTGDRRLIALARALLRNCHVLLLEDPLRGLTAAEETRALKALKRAAKNRTTIITSSGLDPSRSLCDHLLRLEAGRLTDRAIVPEAPTAPVAERPAGVVEIGQILPGGYTMAGLLQRQPFTETWLAWHAEGADLVDVKVPRWASAIGSARAELAEEFAIANQLEVPGLARPLAAELDGPIPFTVYERVEGHLLAHLIGASAPTDEMAEDRIDPVEIGYQLATALAAIHRLGYVHLNLVLDVVRLGPDGIVIVDLRRARPTGSRLPRYGELQRRGGIAPEQLAGEVAEESMDLYALGAILYQLITGRLLARGERVHMGAMTGTGVDADLASLIAELTAPTPHGRTAASEAAVRLRSLLRSATPRAEVDGDNQARRDRARHHGSATEMVIA